MQPSIVISSPHQTLNSHQKKQTITSSIEQPKNYLSLTNKQVFQSLSNKTIDNGIHTHKRISRSKGKTYTINGQYEIPQALSYQNRKLANFIELQVSDLSDSLQQLNSSNNSLQNPLKESLSRCYNVFHEMEKLYSDLGMNFLYQQSKKLISSLSLIIMQIMERLERYQNCCKCKIISKYQDQKLQEQIEIKKRDQSICENIEKYIENSLFDNQYKIDKKLRKKYAKFQGVYLYNQSYSRHIDYDIEAFRLLREQNKAQNATAQQILALKQEEEKEFKKSVVQELNDYSYLTVDNEDITHFLNRQRQVNDQLKSMSLGDELEKIAKYFKQSQNQAVEFLRKSKNQQSFHELTQGFNIIVQEYKNQKSQKAQLIQEKIKEILDILKQRNRILQSLIITQEEQIARLKQEMKKTAVKTYNADTQTIHNFDEEIRQLFSRIVQQQMMNEEMKNYIKKTMDEDKKNKESLIVQINLKEGYLRQNKDLLHEKTTYCHKLEKKIKLLQEGNKNKNFTDPISYFNSLDRDLKKALIDQFREQGLIPQGKHMQAPAVKVSRGKNSNAKSSQLSDFHMPLEHEFSNTPVLEQNPKKKGSTKTRMSFNMKKSRPSQPQDYTQQNLLIQAQKNEDNSDRLMKKINFDKSPINNISSLKKQSDSITETPKNLQSEKQSSRRIIKIKLDVRQSINVEKERVFDVFDRSNFNYSQSYIDSECFKSQKSITSKNHEITMPLQSNDNINTPKQKSNTPKKNTSNKKQDSQKIFSTTNQEQESAPKTSHSNDHEVKPVIANATKRQKDSKIERDNQKTKAEDPESNKIGSQKRLEQQIYYNKKITQEESVDEGEIIQNIIGSDTQVLNKQGNFLGELEQQKAPKSIFYVTKKHQSQLAAITGLKNKQIKNQFSLIISEPSRQLQTNKNVATFHSKIMNKTNSTMLTSLHNHRQSQQNYQMSKMKKLELKNEISSHNNSLSKNLEKNTYNSTIKEKKDMKYQTSNTFKEQTRTRKNKYKHTSQDQLKNEAQKMLRTHKSSNLSANISVYNQTRALKISDDILKNYSKDKNSRNKFSSQEIEKMYHQNFQEMQVIQAAKQSKNLQQFHQKVYNLHFAKCGDNCKHLKRYLSTFLKIKNMLATSKRQTIKMSIENINFSHQQQQNLLPSLKHK